MISAPNRLRLSNGNNWLLAILSYLLLAGCASATSSSSRTKVLPPDPREIKEEAPALSVDTIQWTFNPEEEFPPISIDSKVAAYKFEKVVKEHYRIVLLLPMRINDGIPNLSLNNKKFADFYAGIKLAASRMSDIEASIQVYYTNREEEKLDAILAELSFNLPDLIIASYESELIAKTALFGKEHRIPVISPWKSSTSIADDNVFYLQMRPSIDHYFQRIIEHVSYNYDHKEVRIIQRTDGQDNSKTRLLHKIQEESSALPIVIPFETIDVDLDSLMDSESTVFDTAIVSGIKAFILPHYSSRDESFIYSCLRKMYGEKGSTDLYVYTMPIALSSERIDINILKNLNIRTAEFRFPDPKNRQVKKFRKDFYLAYGWLPTEDAYYGFDLMSFIEYGLNKHGQYFHYFMAGKSLDLMQMKINIQPFYKDDDRDRPDFMTNDHLYIIEFDRDHFTVKDIR